MFTGIDFLKIWASNCFSGSTSAFVRRQQLGFHFIWLCFLDSPAVSSRFVTTFSSAALERAEGCFICKAEKCFYSNAVEVGGKSSCEMGSCVMAWGWIPTPTKHSDLLTGKGGTKVSFFLRKSTVSRYVSCAYKGVCVFMYFLIKLLCWPLVIEEWDWSLR